MNLKFIIILITLLSGQFSQAEVLISADRNPVVDEPFKLIFETHHKVDGEPDFSPLEQSFMILSKGHSNYTQIDNGNVTRSRKWILTVLAKQFGVLPIPSIRFGSEASQAASIAVLANTPSTKGNNTDDIFVEVEVNTKTPYVQAQVLYTIKLYRSVKTNNEKLFDPEISGGQAIIKRSDEDKTFEIRLKGRHYVVTERQFVIFPQSSGRLKIEPLMFRAQVGGNGFFNFDPFGSQPKSIVKRSDSVELDVKPIPGSFIGDTWLPAKQLSIREQWSIDPARLKQGEATTRTLTLKAVGLAASNLPEIKSKLPDRLKQYPDQPELTETIDENGFVSFRHDKMAIIPIEAGDYILPAVKIAWWNTESDKMEFAELHERTIHANIFDAAPVTSVQEPLVEEKASAEKVLDDKNTVISEPASSQTFWKWLSLILFLLWIMTLFVFWKSKRKLVFAEDDSASDLSRRQYLKQLKQACIKNDAAMVKQALLNWAKVNWSDKSITNINAMKEFCTDELKIKIDELNNCLYGKEHNKWNGAGFVTVFESQSFNKKTTTKEKGKLEPLYKTQP